MIVAVVEKNRLHRRFYVALSVAISIELTLLLCSNTFPQAKGARLAEGPRPKFAIFQSPRVPASPRLRVPFSSPPPPAPPPQHLRPPARNLHGVPPPPRGDPVHQTPRVSLPGSL